jgi:hypothetical protein
MCNCRTLPLGRPNIVFSFCKLGLIDSTWLSVLMFSVVSLKQFSHIPRSCLFAVLRICQAHDFVSLRSRCSGEKVSGRYENCMRHAPHTKCTWSMNYIHINFFSYVFSCQNFGRIVFSFSMGILHRVDCGCPR